MFTVKVLVVQVVQVYGMAATAVLAAVTELRTDWAVHTAVAVAAEQETALVNTAVSPLSVSYGVKMERAELLPSHQQM